LPVRKRFQSLVNGKDAGRQSPGSFLASLLRTTTKKVILRRFHRRRIWGKGLLKAKTDSPLAMLGATENQVLRVAQDDKAEPAPQWAQDVNRAGAQDHNKKVILRAVPSPEGSDLGVETWSFADVEYDKRIYLIRNQSIK
jgi:hypothetical protein